MPPFKAIPSLYSLSLDLIAESLLLSNHHLAPSPDDPPGKGWFSNSPPGMKLSDIISAKMLSKCSLQSSLPSLFHRCIPNNVLRLDLTGFVRFGPVDSDIFNTFDDALSRLIIRLPLVRELILKTHEKFTYIPKVRNHHLHLISQYCPYLEELDISYNKLVTGEGLQYLSSNQELIRLYIFKVRASDSDVLSLLKNLPQLKHLGYKSLGNVVHKMSKKRRQSRREGGRNGRKLRLTHLDNTGTYGHQATGLRCRPTLLELLRETCPDIRTLKLRVKDEDVSGFKLSDNVKNLELIYNVGIPSAPSIGTLRLMSQCGENLSSVALVCSSISGDVLRGIAFGCKSLESLWIRSNTLSNTDVLLCDKRHEALKRLRILYIRIGENADISPLLNSPGPLLKFLLLNAGPSLSELTLSMSSPLLNDAFVFELFVELHLKALRKALFLLPGENTSESEGSLPLSLQTLHFILQFCPEMVKIGNVGCWSVGRGEVSSNEELREFRDGNYNINIVDSRSKRLSNVG